jgi:CRISPR-associated protein Cas1
MTNRILEIAESGAKLRLKFDCLIVERESKSPISIPLVDLAAIVLAHPAITLTQPILAACGTANVGVIVCDDRFTPSAVLTPVAANHLQTARLRMQIEAAEPLRKRLWQRLVRAKLVAQARALSNDAVRSRIVVLSREIRSGDPDNIEAQAAKIYWKALFGREFVRDRNADDLNRVLNYGYAILRAIVARAVVATGLHPSIGLHHHNKYDAFVLADDLMEPLRPIVDTVAKNVSSSELSKDTRQQVLASLLEPIEVDGEKHTLFDASIRMARSLLRAFETTESDVLWLPT